MHHGDLQTGVVGRLDREALVRTHRDRVVAVRLDSQVDAGELDGLIELCVLLEAHDQAGVLPRRRRIVALVPLAVPAHRRFGRLGPLRDGRECGNDSASRRLDIEGLGAAVEQILKAIESLSGERELRRLKRHLAAPDAVEDDPPVAEAFDVAVVPLVEAAHPRAVVHVKRARSTLAAGLRLAARLRRLTRQPRDQTTVKGDPQLVVSEVRTVTGLTEVDVALGLDAGQIVPVVSFVPLVPTGPGIRTLGGDVVHLQDGPRDGIRGGVGSEAPVDQLQLAVDPESVVTRLRAAALVHIQLHLAGEGDGDVARGVERAVNVVASVRADTGADSGFIQVEDDSALIVLGQLQRTGREDAVEVVFLLQFAGVVGLLALELDATGEDPRLLWPRPAVVDELPILLLRDGPVVTVVTMDGGASVHVDLAFVPLLFSGVDLGIQLPVEMELQVVVLCFGGAEVHVSAADVRLLRGILGIVDHGSARDRYRAAALVLVVDGHRPKGIEAAPAFAIQPLQPQVAAVDMDAVGRRHSLAAHRLGDVQGHVVGETHGEIPVRFDHGPVIRR